MKSKSTEGDGVIQADRAYTINAFCRELGLKTSQGRRSPVYREMVRDGLPVRRGRYILGQDFLDFLGQSQADGDSNQD